MGTGASRRWLGRSAAGRTSAASDNSRALTTRLGAPGSKTSVTGWRSLGTSAGISPKLLLRDYRSRSHRPRSGWRRSAPCGSPTALPAPRSSHETPFPRGQGARLRTGTAWQRRQTGLSEQTPPPASRLASAVSRWSPGSPQPTGSCGQSHQSSPGSYRRRRTSRSISWSGRPGSKTLNAEASPSKRNHTWGVEQLGGSRR